MHATLPARRIFLPVLVTLLLSAPAIAAPTQADKETARTLMDQGDAKAEAKNFAEALKLYQAAHDLMGVPTTGLEVARTQAALGQLLEARDTALAVSRIAPQPREPRVFAQARLEAQRLADALSSRIPAVHLRVTGVADDAELQVQVDGALVPSSAALLPRKVNPGKHHIEVTAGGYKAASQDVQVPEGKVVEVTLELEREAGSAEALPTKTRPTSSAEFAPARATSSGGLPTLSYIGFGVGAAGLITGSITGLMTFSKKSSIKSTYCGGTNTCDPAAQDGIDDGRTLATVSNIAFGVGIVGVGVALAAWIAAPNEVSSPTASARKPRVEKGHVSVMPVLGVQAFGLHGTF